MTDAAGSTRPDSGPHPVARVAGDTGPHPSARVAGDSGPYPVASSIAPLGPTPVDVTEADLDDGGALASIVSEYRAHHPKAEGAVLETDVGTLEKAFEVAARAHREQRRKSGEPYFVHPVRVATTLAQLGADIGIRRLTGCLRVQRGEIIKQFFFSTYGVSSGERTKIFKPTSLNIKIL